MTSDLLRPVLLVIVPADWDPVSEGVAELRRCLADEYGASLMLRQAIAPLSSPLPLYAGYWEPGTQWYAKRDVTPRLAQAFVDLNWLDAELEAG
ncbi:hypothetical protein [Deinococcus soli (ex Cha et al. 2016)]|uniref:hypothetical protein n=1 Tax=Deinococcus soli (ex Cha et al. 2016) TaxID=1309411 RepID=UPI0016689E46|nr:hypothetical protein [Deinococcus soli (ex Cha et al. 2016)]GGB62514.1 hypothetical protein GCM10008019_18090 [Deinococcus soli (ex Cha et al. 2016)]